MANCNVDRFMLETHIMNCWHITNDLDLLATLISETPMSAEDQDKLMNIVIGLKDLYNARFDKTFLVFEQLVADKCFGDKFDDL